MKRVRFAVHLNTNDVVAMRVAVVEFCARYGSRATVDAYGISRATIFRWKRMYKRTAEDPDSLLPKSTAPLRVRRMKTDPRIIARVRTLREEHYRLGKEKIKPLLDMFCRENGIIPISVSTIGKVIARNSLHGHGTHRIYHDPGSKYARKRVRYRSKVRYSPKETEFGYIEIDTITRFVNGLKAYIFNAVDVKGKVQFSYAYSTLTSANGCDFFKKLESVYPIRDGIRIVQTDNGLEYLGAFHRYLEQQKIPHVFIYPRCPKINAYIERANRSLSEEFIAANLELLFNGFHVFNTHLMDHLIWYNTKRVHKGLGNMTPIDYLLKSYTSPESHMYVTHTQH